MSAQILKPRMIFKVLVLGRDLALQTGFLCQASGNTISTQLFNTLGVSLGVAKIDEREDIDVVIQLWALPQKERLAGLSANFARGHRGAFIVVRSNELMCISELLGLFSIKNKSNLIITIIRSTHDTEINSKTLSQIIGEFDICNAKSIDDLIELIAERFISKGTPDQNPIVVLLDEIVCPVFEPVEMKRSVSIISDTDIDEIRAILLDLGLRVIEESCIIELVEGTAFVSLRTGCVSLEPIICNFCVNECKRKNSICIIAVDSGWSSKGIGQKALLATSKAIALAERALPNHVELQIQRACTCSRFILNPSIREDELPMILRLLSDIDECSTKSLLDVATERLRQGRLPTTAFNILKSRVDAIKKITRI